MTKINRPWARPGQPQRYGREHHAECMCGACWDSYYDHNIGAVCNCFDCNTTRTIQAKGSKQVATVNFCERCNTMGKSNIMGTISYQTVVTEPVTTVEICPGCVAEFLDWWSVPEAIPDVISKQRPRSYTKPYEKPETADPLANMTTEDLATILTARLALGSGKDNTE